MPRLSLYKENKGNDYKFFDRRIFEMFTIGGTAVNVHKYLGPASDPKSTDATQPAYATQSEKNIQDLLFLENRDRKYDKDVFSLRGVYSVSDIDFDLTQFGLFLANDTVFIVFHYNDMIERIGRKLIAGDVLELPHLTDYHPLDDDLPTALKRFYVVQEGARASEGYSPTWYSHLWRVKCTPLVDSQEYKDILRGLKADEYSEDSNPLADILSNCKKYQNINDSLLEQASNDVPQSGYDTTMLYVPPATEGETPNTDVKGYLTGDGIAPNGEPVISGTSFPMNPPKGTYVLRVDYFPNRLFRYDGKRWTHIEDALRTELTFNENNKSLKSSFINNDAQHATPSGTVVPERQSLSNALRPLADN